MKAGNKILCYDNHGLDERWSITSGKTYIIESIDGDYIRFIGNGGISLCIAKTGFSNYFKLVTIKFNSNFVLI